MKEENSPERVEKVSDDGGTQTSYREVASQETGPQWMVSETIDTLTPPLLALGPIQLGCWSAGTLIVLRSEKS